LDLSRFPKLAVYLQGTKSSSSSSSSSFSKLALSSRAGTSIPPAPPNVSRVFYDLAKGEKDICSGFLKQAVGLVDTSVGS